MQLVKIGLASLNTTVGAFLSNTKKILKTMDKIAHANCDIGVFQEQTIAGYPTEDLVLWPNFVAGQWQYLEKIKQKSAKLNFKTVFIVGLTIDFKKNLYNSAAIIQNGKILGIVPKQALPNYNIFYESRVFTAGKSNQKEFLANKVPFGDLIFKFSFGKLAVEICEDSWAKNNQTKKSFFKKANIIVNLSASPFRSGILLERKKMLEARSKNKIIIYANQYGANDSLIFDGGGFIYQNGNLLFESKRWQENLAIETINLDLKQNKKFISEKEITENNYQENYFEDLINAIITGLDGFFTKSQKFKKIGLALSGGSDSALTLILAWLWAKKYKKENIIYAFSFPTKFNTKNTKNLAKLLAQELSINFQEINIQASFSQEIKNLKKMLEPKIDITKTTVLHNIQARIRGQKMLNWANAANAMWLQTGNMSEKAVGYTTVGGDLMGDYSLIGNLPKTIALALLAYLNKKLKLKSVEQILKNKPSAELEPNQEDEKDLMPYAVLDTCLGLFFELKLDKKQIYAKIKELFPQYKSQEIKNWVEKFLKLTRNAIYKWELSPQSAHLNNLNLDRSRALQLPVIQSSEWL